MKKLFTILFTALLSMTVGTASAYDAEIDGIFYNFNGNEAEVTFKNASSIFNYSGKVEIPESVTYNGKTYQVTAIGENAFFNCNKLNAVSIPNTVKTIGSGAFKTNENLTSITIGNSVTTIGDLAFFSCTNLPSVTLPNTVLTIGERAFSECRKLSSITIPNSVKTIGAGLFWNCTSLESVILGSTITTITDHMFSNCNSLNSVIIPNSVTNIESLAFYLCSKLESVIIPNSVKSIGEKAFQACYNLSYVSIGNSVTSIGDEAFKSCNSLKDVNITDIEAWLNITMGYNANPLLHAHHLLLNNEEVKSLVIPNSVTKIGKNLFAGISFQSLTIGSGVLEIEGNAFDTPTKTIWLTNTPPKGYQYAVGIVNYVSNDGYTFDSNKKSYVYPLLSSMFAVDGVKYVPISMADRTCDAFDAVYDESAALTKIGTSATYKGVTFKVNNVNPYTCCGNTFIKNVELTDLPYIDDHVFDGCSNLQNVKLPETVTSLGISSFQDCESLQEMTIPAATQIVTYNAFKGCKSLKNVIMDDGTETLTLAYNKVSFSSDGTPLFEDCPLDYVYIGRNINYGTEQSEGYSPFYRNTSLRTVKITDQETEISENEFYGCSGLKNVQIGNGVTTIGNWAFSGCSSLDYFEFGGSMQTIGTEAFSDCTAVTKIISHAATPPTCGSQALDDINKWNCTLIVPDGNVADYQQADQWKEFLFVEGISTDIQSFSTETGSKTAIYSFAGQRLTAPRKGINIIGGKKVVIK